MSDPATKRGTESLSATKRMERARDEKLESNTRELLWAVIFGTHTWPSFLARPRVPDVKFPWVLCIDSPAGRLAYKLAEAELGLVEHLDRRNAPDPELCSPMDRTSRLLHLASEGW